MSVLRRAPARAALLALGAALAAAPAAHAAAPEVTGLSTVALNNFGGAAITISGHGFTGATAVHFGANTAPQFTVVSDTTIKVTQPPSGPGDIGVTVTAGGATSPVTPTSTIRITYGPNVLSNATVKTVCELGGAGGAHFNATLNTLLQRVTPSVMTPGRVSLAPIQAYLTVPNSAPLTNSPLGPLTGPVTTTSIDAHVTGSSTGQTIDLMAGHDFTYPLPSSADGNPLAFYVADGLASGASFEDRTGATVLLEGYHATVTLSSGPSTLDCTPSDANRTVFPVGGAVPTTPPPVVTGLSSSMLYNLGGQQIIVSGSGFTGAIAVSFGGTPTGDFTVVSDSTIKATVPALGAAASSVTVTTPVGDSAVDARSTFRQTYGPYSGRTSAVPLTCGLNGATATPFDATLSAELGQADGNPYSPYNPTPVAAGSTVTLASPRARLAIPNGRALLGTPLGGTGLTHLTVGSLDATVTGATTASAALGAGGPAFSTLASTSTDGNPVEFLVADLGPTTLTAGSAGPLTVALRGLHASVTIDGVVSVAPITLDCTPKAGADATLFKTTVTGGPVPGGANFAVKGAATLKTLAKGTVALAGSLNGSVDGGAFTGDLALDPATARLVAYGFLPVVAKLQFAPVGQATGTLDGGPFQLTTQQRIKLPSVKLFGLELVQGKSCQTALPSTFTLRSAGAFDATKRGSLAGTFAISNLTGCGSLQGIVSPLTKGAGNAIALTLTPQG